MKYLYFPEGTFFHNPIISTQPQLVHDYINLSKDNSTVLKICAITPTLNEVTCNDNDPRHYMVLH